MLTFILRRVLSGLVLIVVITVLAFTLLYLGSGNIARTIVGQNATQEVVAQKAAELGLDRPLFAQFLDWASSAVTGDLGRSWFNGQLVSRPAQQPARRHAVAGDRRDHPHRHLLRDPGYPRRPPRRSGRRHRPVRLDPRASPSRAS